jgi:hypothetical protein
MSPGDSDSTDDEEPLSVRFAQRQSIVQVQESKQRTQGR